jgi:hypothetical protein
MMEEDFDFDKVGKRMPYKVPSGFFDSIAGSTLAEAEKRAAAKKEQTPPVLWRVLAVAASVAVLVTIGYFMYTGSKLKNDNLLAGAVNIGAAGSDTLLIPEPVHPLATQNKSKAAPGPKAANAPIPEQQQQQQQQLASAAKPETLDEILASISDEELLLLAAIVKSEQYVYEQTVE